MKSHLSKGNAVTFPEFKNERIYMLPFTQKDGLPQEFSHWQQTIDQMLGVIRTDKQIYLMVDQDVVLEGHTHRRAGKHVDGYWIPGAGHNTHSKKIYTGSHHDTPGRHSTEPVPGHGGFGPSHMRSDLNNQELLILASDVLGCRGFVGDYDPEFGEGGQVEFDTTDLEEVVMHPGVAWVGGVFTIHESIPQKTTRPRTVVRLNVPMI